MGVGGQERNLKKAYNYFQLGTPGGLEGCQRRFRKKSTMKEKSADDDGLAWDPTVNEVYNCDHPCLNGKGLLHLYGLPMMVRVMTHLVAISSLFNSNYSLFPSHF